MVDWAAVRAEFPAASRYTYLNTAGAPPVSRRAATEGQQYYDEMLRDGDIHWNDWLHQVERVRGRVARLLGADVAEVAFTYSSSHAFNLVAALLGPAGHVVAMADEFPSGTLPWLRHGDRLTFVRSRDDGLIPLVDIEAAIEPSTRAVVSSSVMYRTGFRQDLDALGALCRRRGVKLVIDASQSMGAIPIDVRRSGIDALAFSGYKWTMAGYGVGAMYASLELLRDALPPAAGWFSAKDPEAVINDRLDLKTSAAAMEVGCPHFAGIFALGGALELLDEIGQPAIENRIVELTDRLHGALAAAGFEIASPREPSQRAGITIVRIRDAASVVEALAREGVIVSARGAGVRVSVHVFNNEADVDRFVEVLTAVQGNRPALGAPAARDPQRNGPVVCVDLNGVLDVYSGWQGAEHWDVPADGAREFLAALHARGSRIIVFTTRHYLGVHRWLTRHGLMQYISEVTDRKPAADVFVDDRAVCHRGDFDETLERVLRFSAHWERS